MLEEIKEILALYHAYEASKALGLDTGKLPNQSESAEQIIALLPQGDEEGLLSPQELDNLWYEWLAGENLKKVDMLMESIAKAQQRLDEHRFNIATLPMRERYIKIGENTAIEEITRLKEKHQKEKAEIFEKIFVATDEMLANIKKTMWKDDWGIKGVIYEVMLEKIVKRHIVALKREYGIE